MALLELEGIRKSFGRVHALFGVDLRIEPGEVHALLGENGAGKSTLVRILAGIEQPDAGTMTLEGAAFAPRSAQDARARGIGVVHQHDSLVDAFSVAENLALGAPRGAGWLSRARLHAVARDAATRAGVELPPFDAPARDLSVGERQRVEIVRALASSPRLLLLDEPTAALAPGEADALLISVRQIAARGVGVVFISHYLREVMEVADRVTVLRGGGVVLGARRDEVESAALAHAMVGETVTRTEHARASRGAPRLVARGLQTAAADDPSALRGVDLSVHGGECVGVAGVAGNGQRALVAALEGVIPLLGGSLRIDGVECAGADAQARRARGLAIVPEERRSEGLALRLSIAENLLLSSRALSSMGAMRGAAGFVLKRGDVLSNARARIERYGVQPAYPGAIAATLSGGNQQRVVLARELHDVTSVAVLAQPTRGLDVKATEFVHAEIERLRAEGVAVLLVSTDLSETLRLSDRILVMLRGRIGAEFPRGTDAAAIGRAMIGAGGEG